MYPPAFPTSRPPARLLAVLALAYAGGVIAYLPLLSLLLPMKVDAVAGAARLDVLTAGVVAGAVASSLSNIAFGALSDRSHARGRGRRRWIAGGLAGLAAAYAGIIAAGSPAGIVAAVVAFQVAVNAVLAPLMAIMAEEVPDAQKGLLGGLLALGPPAASGLAALLVGAEGLGETARLAIVPLASAACLAPLLMMRAARPNAVAAPAAQARGSRRDLVIAWVARLLVQVAGNVLFTYLLFYFDSVVDPAQVGGLAGRVSRLLLVAALLPLPIALVAGRLSDRTGWRKPILFAAAVLAAAGLGAMALAHSWTAGALAFAAYTAGSAVFLALHETFAMQLLPSPRHRGRDLGLLNLTNTLPAFVGPLLTWVLATPRNFAPLMLVLAGLAFLGGVTMLVLRRSPNRPAEAT